MSQYRTWNIDQEVEIRSGEGLASRPAETVPQVFQQTVAKFASANALHFKRDGEWHALTFQEYYDKSAQFGKALLHLGVERFAGVCIIGFNSVEWMTSMLGTIMAGGVAVGIYATNEPHACEHVVNHSGSVVVVCDGVQQLEKFLAIQKTTPQVKALVVWNAEVPEGIQSSVPVYSFDKFLELGNQVEDEKLQERLAVQKPGHCCSLIYTSGTTGAPKAVMISHDNFTWTVQSLLVMATRQLKLNIGNQYRYISFLPLSHIAAQLLDLMVPLASGVQLYFAQPDALKGSLAVTMREVRPHLLFGVPRVFEKIYEKAGAMLDKTTGAKKLLVDWARRKGAQRTAMAQYGASGGVPCGYSVADSLFFNRVKKVVGLDETILVVSAAAPISREVVEFFGTIGMFVYDLFGQSEATGPQTTNLDGMWKIGTSGMTLDGMNTRVDPNTQELLFNGRNIMMGYFRGEKETKEAIDDDGWLHTGDCGFVDEDGFMTVTGRIKELIITAGGENIPPLLLEEALKNEIPLISNVVVVGDKRKFLSCLFTLRVQFNEDGTPTDKLDTDSLRILTGLGSKATTVAEAKACPLVQAYLEAGLKRANAKATSRAHHVQKFAILPVDFSTEGGEMTATLKTRRHVVLTKYGAEVDSIYA